MTKNPFDALCEKTRKIVAIFCPDTAEDILLNEIIEREARETEKRRDTSIRGNSRSQSSSKKI